LLCTAQPESTPIIDNHALWLDRHFKLWRSAQMCFTLSKRET